MSSKDYGLSGTEYGVAGAISGAFTRFTCQPFDVVKIRFQIQTLPVSSQASDAKYTSILQAVIRIKAEEGIFGLWKGHLPAQWLSVVYGAVQFSTYEYICYGWRENSMAHFAGGAFSGVLATIASFPFDVARTRLVAQAEPKIYRGMMDAGHQVFMQEGYRGLFKGLVPACMQTAPLSSLIFGFHYIISSFLKRVTGNEDSLTTIGSLSSGAIAGFAAKTTIYPLDLAKKRLQIQGMPGACSASGPVMQTSGLIDCFIVTFRSEGIRGLYKGLSPSILKAAVSSAVYLTSYDKACQLISFLKHC